MKMNIFVKNLRIMLAFIIGLLLSSCGTFETAAGGKGGNDVYLRIWAHSDIQPRQLNEKYHYETAIADMLYNVPGIQMAIVAGDLVHRRDGAEEYHRWLAELKNRSEIPHWFEIAGNHDQNNIQAYRKYTGRPLHYAVEVGNMFIILMSDEIKSTVTEISDEAFEWWRGLVIKNRDSILITVTHGALHGSGLLCTINETMRIEGSERFVRVLKKYPVDLWLSGHSHLPSILGGNITQPPGLGTLFVDISSIHKSRFSPIESYLLEVKSGSDLMDIMLRNHEGGRFLRSRSVKLRLRTGLKWDGGDPKIISTCCAR